VPLRLLDDSDLLDLVDYVIVKNRSIQLALLAPSISTSPSMLQNVEETKLALQTLIPKASRMQLIMHRRHRGTQTRKKTHVPELEASTSIQLGLGSPQVAPASASRASNLYTATRGPEETTTQRDGRPRHGTPGRSALPSTSGLCDRRQARRLVVVRPIYHHALGSYLVHIN